MSHFTKVLEVGSWLADVAVTFRSGYKSHLDGQSLARQLSKPALPASLDHRSQKIDISRAKY